MNKEAKTKSAVLSTLFTLGVLFTILIIGPALAVKLALLNPSTLTPEKGDLVTFEAHIDLETGEVLPFTNVQLDINGQECDFEMTGGSSTTDNPLCECLSLSRMDGSSFQYRRWKDTYYSEDFESGEDGWSHEAIDGNDTWELRTVAHGTDEKEFDSTVFWEYK